jgi:DNA-binding NtrC family response regulator
MRTTTASAIASPASVSILSVSANDEDHSFFAKSARTDPEWVMSTNAKWDVYRAFTVPSAIHALRGGQIPVLICTDELAKETWQDLLGEALALQDPPSVILASRLADDRLWAEAINLGAYDVLSKPFVGSEVIRVVAAAWVSWLGRQRNARNESSPRSGPSSSGTPPPAKRSHGEVSCEISDSAVAA